MKKITMLFAFLFLLLSFPILAAPTVALYPLGFTPDSQGKNIQAIAELVTAELMIMLGNSEQVDLLDRSALGLLRSESAGKAGGVIKSDTQAELAKLPLASYSLLGDLLQPDGEYQLHLRLVENRSARIIGAANISLQLPNLDKTIESVEPLIGLWLARSEREQQRREAVPELSVAFGHFIDLNQDERNLPRGREISANLISAFSENENYSLLNRTQSFPLLLEQYLRQLQYPNTSATSRVENADLFIRGKYLVDSDREQPISLYLRLDIVGYRGQTQVLHAKDWPQAHKKIAQAVSRMLAGSSAKSISDGAKARADIYFSEAFSLTAGKKRDLTTQKINRFEIEDFGKSLSADGIAEARLLLSKALADNPSHSLAKLALAQLFESSGDHRQSRQLLEEVMRSHEKSSVEIADYLLAEQNRKQIKNLSPNLFHSFADAKIADRILQQLLDQNFIQKTNNGYVLNTEEKAAWFIFWPDKIVLEGLDRNTQIQAVETLRERYYSYGTRVVFSAPKRRNRSEIESDPRNWSYLTFSSNYNTEANLHYHLARSSHDSYIDERGTLPEIQQYPDSLAITETRRQLNLEIAVDGFANSYRLDSRFLQAAVMLGYALCQQPLNKCASGNTVLEWLLDNAKDIRNQTSGFIDVSEQQWKEERDKLLFLAADAVDLVDQAPLSDIFRADLIRSQYTIRKHRQTLDRLLKQQVDPDYDATRSRVQAYAQLLAAYCAYLRYFPDKLENTQVYAPSMQEFASWAQDNSLAADLRTQVMDGLARKFPEVYPYLILSLTPINPDLKAEQDRLIEAVVAKAITPLSPPGFFGLMHKRTLLFAREGKHALAASYIAYLKDYSGINESNALLFAQMYHQNNDADAAHRLLEQFAMAELLLQDYGMEKHGTEKHGAEKINARYFLLEFNRFGEAVYQHEHEEKLRMVFDARRATIGAIAQRYHWNLYLNGKIEHSNTNKNKMDSLCFGNSADFCGAMYWGSAAGDETPAEQAQVSRGDALVAQQQNADIPLRLIKPVSVTNLTGAEPPWDFAALVYQGFQFDEAQQLAFGGFPEKSVIGPLKEEYFASGLGNNRQLDVIQGELFNKGLIDVAGLPTVTDWHELGDKIERFFPDYESWERRAIHEALLSAAKINSAGYVERMARGADGWTSLGRINPADANRKRRFGKSLAISGQNLLVCGNPETLYPFRQVNGQWQQNQPIEINCQQLAMQEDWAAVTTREKVVLFQMRDGVWQQAQVLQPSDYQTRKQRRQKFENFGQTMRFNKDRLFIGNQFGGEGGFGEVYVFKRQGTEWRQEQILLHTEYSGFGGALATLDDYLLVGASYGQRENKNTNGAVLLYRLAGTDWQLQAYLAPELTAKATGFGKGIEIKKPEREPERPEVYIRSNRQLFHYLLDPPEIKGRIKGVRVN